MMREEEHYREEEYNNVYKHYSGEETNEKMNRWKDTLSSPADTYIEWCFEQKCKQLSKGFSYITEWRKRKLQYVAITETTIWNFQNYSRHDASHSIAILEAIESLLGKKRIDFLSAGDLWLLLEAAYSHDVGMAMTYEELMDLWENNTEFQDFIMDCITNDFGDLGEAAMYYKQIDNLLRQGMQMKDLDGRKKIEYGKEWPVLSYKYFFILINEYIRKHHTERIERLLYEIDKETEPVIPFRLYGVSMRVSRMHGMDFEDILKELKYSTKGFGSGVIHPQFAAAMLRIGDLLDIDNNRFNPYAVKHFGRLPLASLLHMKKHKAITHIDIAEDRINVEAHSSEYDVCLLTDEWFNWIDREVKELICYWNEIVPEALRGCKLKQSKCKVYLKAKDKEKYHLFNSQFRREFNVNKKKLIKLLIGTSIYKGEMEFFREYIQNAMDASKMQLWLDLKNGKYESHKNPEVELERMTPFDLENGVYDNYTIKLYVDWNESRDKIVLKICDQGIGIEREYIDQLCNIGTGWRGRKRYEGDLKKMLKWLYPTGGFGIGIQSAFMITDSVEIITKADNELNGYHLYLKSPDREGSISIEEMDDLYMRGTTVIFEIEPEKMQLWMQNLDKQEEKRVDLYDPEKYKFDGETYDMFDPDGNLIYAQKFFYEYIRSYVLDPLFPIEVVCPVHTTLKYQNPYWGELCYWKKSDSYISKNLVNNDKEYLCIYVNKQGRTKATIEDENVIESQEYFMSWEYSKCVFQVIKPSKGKKNINLCFKNVLVLDVGKELLKLFASYSGLIDFIGFHVESCLKVHRNSFDEHFPLEQYCRIGFEIYFKFLSEMLDELKETEKDNAADENVDSNHQGLNKGYFENIWNEFSARLLRTILFNGMFDKEYSDKVGERQRSIVVCDLQPDENGKFVIREKMSSISENEIIEHLSEFYQLFNRAETKKMNMANPESCILLKVDDNVVADWRKKKQISPSNFTPDIIIGWQNKEESSNKNTDNNTKNEVNSRIAAENALKDSFKDGKIEMIADKEILEILQQDKKIEKEMFILTDNYNHKVNVLVLLFKPDVEIPEKADFYKVIGERAVRETRRVIYSGREADKYYPKLRVSSIPFCKKEEIDEDGYLISPVSAEKYRGVMEYKKLKKKINYDIFREIVWGKKGQETQSYTMLIDWVVKHQYKAALYSREEIIKEYERFLKSIYEECIRETGYEDSL